MGHDEVHVIDVDESVAVDARHLVIHLGDDELGDLRRRLDHVHADAKAHVPVFVGRRGLDEGDVDADEAAVEQGRNVREGNRRIVRGARIHRVPGVVADKEGIVAEVPLEFRVGVGAMPKE